MQKHAGRCTEDIVNPVPNPEVPEVNVNQKMLDAPAAPRSAAQTRLKPTEEGIYHQPYEKKIKGQQPTGPTTQEELHPPPLLIL
eukprot:314746-Heterocapsa_arctica.AAC.1